MKFLHRFACLLLMLSSLAAADSPQRIIIAHATVIDGISQTPRRDQTVVLSGKRIEWIGPAGSIRPAKSDIIVDARGKYLIPGLWDMHVHIAGVNADPSWGKQTLLPLLLANGITGVRDMGGDLDALLAWNKAVESGVLVGPHIYAGGPWLASRGKKSAEQWPVANADEARAAVRELKSRGANFIKIISLPSRDSFFALADEARRQHIPFVGHLPPEVTSAEAAAAGMRGIEHLFYSNMALAFSSKEAELRQRLLAADERSGAGALEQIIREAAATFSPEKAAALALVLNKNGTSITPTLASLQVTSHPESWRGDDPNLAYVPAALADEWRKSINDDKLANRAGRLARETAIDWKLTSEFHRNGALLLVGSDSLDPFVFPGDSLHRELAEFVRAGFTPIEVLQAATRDATRFLGIDQMYGTIEKGKMADMVLLDANPLEDIGNTRRIGAVVFAGKYIDRRGLDIMLECSRADAAAVK